MLLEALPSDSEALPCYVVGQLTLDTVMFNVSESPKGTKSNV